MTKILIVGCGDLGGAVAKQLSCLGFETIGLRRRNERIAGVTIIQADVTQQTSLNILHQIQPDILIYSVAADGQTDEQYKANYVDGLANVLNTQSDNPKLKHVFFVSSTRVYGQQTEGLLDESIPAIPADFGGERLLQAEQLLDALSCNTTVLRLSGIYGEGRLRMIDLAKSPERWPTQNSWTNRIHRDDAAAFIVFLASQVPTSQSIETCYIVTDSNPVSQFEVLCWIAEKMNIKTEIIVPAVQGGKRLSNCRLLATGFKLQYPDYRAGYSALLLMNAVVSLHLR